MVSWMSEVEYSILSHGAFLRVARVRVVECQSFTSKTTSFKYRVVIFRVPSILIYEFFSYGILCFLERVDVNPVWCSSL